ncbi:MAG: tetratricopeptide repeat protein [Kiritimatiellae bacterium]|nr:tetratricopeptide repeat protein [Kiritimatiellia bacterium]
MRSLSGGVKLTGLVVACLALFLSMTVIAAGQADSGAKENPSAILKAGKAALEDKLYEVAQSQFEQYLKKSPASGKETEEAVILLMRALHEQGKNAEIITLYKSRKGWIEKPERIDAFTFWNAFALYELGKYGEAIKELNEFGKNYPSSEYAGRGLRLMVRCYLQTGQTNAAIQAFADFDRVYGNSPETTENMLEWGKILLSINKIDQAREIFSRLVKLPADQVTVQNGYYWYGITLIEAKKWDDAAATLLALAANTKAGDDMRAEALLAVATALNAVSKKDDALDALRRGMELAKSPELKLKGEFAFARYLVDLGRLEQGVPLLKQYIAKSPTNPIAEAAHLRLAGALLENKKYQESVDEYQHFLETFTNVTGQAEALAGKGWALTGMARHAEAAATFLKAYGLFVDTVRKEQCLFKVGDAYFANNQFTLAMETYERFLKEFPESKLAANALFQTGECLASSDKPADAEMRFREVSEKYADSPFAEEALLRIGEIRASQGKWLEAVYAFNRVMGVYSNGLLYAQALHGRGVANYQLMNFDEALRDFSGVTNRFTTSAMFEHSYYMSGRCAYWLGNDERALQICRDFIKRYPDSQWAPEAMFWMANYEYNEGAYGDAEKDFLYFVA